MKFLEQQYDRQTVEDLNQKQDHAKHSRSFFIQRGIARTRKDYRHKHTWRGEVGTFIRQDGEGSSRVGRHLIQYKDLIPVEFNDEPIILVYAVYGDPFCGESRIAASLIFKDYPKTSRWFTNLAIPRRK